MRTLAARRIPAYHATLTEYPGDMRQTWRCHDEAIITLILAGEVREGVGRYEQCAGTMQLGIKPAGIPHTDHFGPWPLRALRIAFSPGHGTISATAIGALQQWTWRSSPTASRALLVAATALIEHDESALDAHIWDVLAGFDVRADPSLRGNPPAWLRHAREQLLESAHELPLRTLAATAGVHPVHFAAQFRCHYGCITNTFRQRQRVQRATNLLQQGDASLSQLAATLGYADQAHFGRQFRRVAGVSPGRYRELVRGDPPFKRSRHSRGAD